VLNDTGIVDRFCSQYTEWLLSSTNHSIHGLEDFKIAVYSQGTTESFDKFYMRHNTRRFRCFKTEYMYHQLAWRNGWPNWKYLEDDSLDKNDAVIISMPFADTGDKHRLQEQVLNECDRLGIPVLIDCAYFSISTGIDMDFTHPCITDVTFSLSKAFPIAHARIGLRLTRIDDDDTLFVYQKSFYNNRLGAALGLEFLNNFTSDYVPNKYREKQAEFCNLLNIVPSKTVLFGIADSGWNEYNRGGQTNRLSLHKYLHMDVEQFKGVIDVSTIK
jgi:histidinol-phosphate/aromatic aminotransferase/cobyric acid decarboxylase-like protein